MMIYPETFEEKTGFATIRTMLKAKCLSQIGKEKIDQISFSCNVEHIKTLLQEVHEFKQIKQQEDTVFPEDHYYDMRPALDKATIEGTYLEITELHHLYLSLTTIQHILRFFNQKEELYPDLTHLCHSVTIPPFVTEKINALLNKDGQLKDNASSELLHIRNNLQAKKAEASAKMEQIFQQVQKEGMVESDRSLTVRNGRMVIPLAAKLKRKINGYIHDESSSGQTVYIEPSQVVAINNEIRELEHAENREIINILTSVTNDIRPCIDDLTSAYQFLGQIDYIRAKALLAIQINANLPILNNTPGSYYKEALHPLLYLAHKTENKKTVPLTFYLDAETRMLLISGPNAGGKSVCLKTFGLLQYMVQCGLLIPVEENSQIGIYEHLFINLGDDQSLENDLSTYSSHLLNMKVFLENADSQSLVLIDELGAGTEPRLGGAIAEAILDRLNQQEVYGVITTHYSNLKYYASSHDNIVNGAMLFDDHRMKPLFQLEIGQPGSSFAFEIAQQIGLDQDLIQKAREISGKEHTDIDTHLKHIAQNKYTIEQKQQSISEKEKALERQIQQYSRELNNIKNLRKDILNKAEKEAEELMTNANKQIENTIRKIKESQAEQNATHQARKEFDQQKAKISQQSDTPDYLLNSKIRKANKQRFRKSATQTSKSKRSQQDAIIREGDAVKIKDQGAIGEVLKDEGKNIRMQIGEMITSVRKSRLEKISHQEYQKRVGTKIPKSSKKEKDPQPSAKDFNPEADIRGKRGEDALQIVKKLIDDAIVLQVEQVKIIHGKGDGILRQLVRDYLKTEEVVRSFRDEKVQLGGSGVTVVDLAV